MAGRTIFFLQHGSFEPAFQATSMGHAAAGIGDEVYFVFSFEALRQLVRGSFGQPHTEREMAESARAEGLGSPTPAKLLQKARVLGARLVAVDTMVRVCGYLPTELEENVVLDQVLSQADLLRLTEGARILSL